MVVGRACKFPVEMAKDEHDENSTSRTTTSSSDINSDRGRNSGIG